MDRSLLAALAAVTADAKHFKARAEVRDGAEKSLVVSLAGSLDSESTNLVSGQLMETIGGWDEGPYIVFDLVALEYISSTGVGLLTTALVAARRHGIALSIENPQPTVMSVLDLLQIGKFIPIRTRG